METVPFLPKWNNEPKLAENIFYQLWHISNRSKIGRNSTPVLYGNWCAISAKNGTWNQNWQKPFSTNYGTFGIGPKLAALSASHSPLFTVTFNIKSTLLNKMRLECIVLMLDWTGMICSSSKTKSFIF